MFNLLWTGTRLTNTLVFLVVLFASVENAFSIPKEKPLRVGAILPLSGDWASSGEAIKNGMMLAVEKLNDVEKKRLELFFEDDQAKPANTIAAYRRLLFTNRINVVVSVISGPSNALAPLAERDKVLMIAIATDPRVVAGKNYVVNFYLTPEAQVSAVIDEVRRRGYRRIARITSIQDMMLSIKGHLDEMAKNKINIELDEEYLPEIRDFKPFLAKLRSKHNLDAIAMLLIPGQLGVFAKQVRQMGIDLPIFGFETMEDSEEVKVSGGALIDQWYVNTDDPNETFISEYRKGFPQASLYAAANGYDIGLLLGEAARRGLDAEELNSFLHELKDFTGALGTYSATGDNRFTFSAAVKVITTDGFKKLSR